MEDTLSQFEVIAGYSQPSVSVDITDNGSIIGRGVTATDHAIGICGGSIDKILQSFGGIQGGNNSPDGKSIAVLDHMTSLAEGMLGGVESAISSNQTQVEDFQTLIGAGEDDVEFTDHVGGVVSALDIIGGNLTESAESIKEYISKSKQFVDAIHSLGDLDSKQGVAGMLSLTLTSVNNAEKLAKRVSKALKSAGVKKDEYLTKSLAEIDEQVAKKYKRTTKSGNEKRIARLVQAWLDITSTYGYKSQIKGLITGGSVDDLLTLDETVGGGLATNTLADRLLKSRNELKVLINGFIHDFGKNINGIASVSDEMSKQLGKEIEYGDDVIAFLDAYARINEFMSDDRTKSIYQSLLELNSDRVDSKEVKERYITILRYLGERADVLGEQGKKFAKYCQSSIDCIHKHSDAIKNHRDIVGKDGGSTESMNELFSVDASKININGLIVPFENLKLSLRKIEFFRNVATFRTNLQQTGLELKEYSKDYAQNVGKTIGEAISKIKIEFNEIITQISDNKTGMGLEIDMYNDSLPKDQKISKEKLKMIYKWQCDARIGLYKTIEAVDLYLLHFTEMVSKNPDALSDLHKMLSATKIIAKWYDQKAGDNLVRFFESFATSAEAKTLYGVDIDDSEFPTKYNDTKLLYAQLKRKVGSDRAHDIYDRSRVAVEGIVVLKNIISYFISIGEKYGNIKTEKNIYMAPSNIYKNLVNYVWVSAIDINTTGAEVLTDNNDTKRLLTYEDTKITLAKANSMDPTTIGINFNRHSIDKLRIMKCHNELLRLRDMISLFDKNDIKRIKQFITGVFARLSKTEYILNMLPFGVYDLSHMDKAMVTKFIDRLHYFRTDSATAYIQIKTDNDTYATYGLDSSRDDDKVIEAILKVPSDKRGTDINILIDSPFMVIATTKKIDERFVSLTLFQKPGFYSDEIQKLMGFVPTNQGFISGFLSSFAIDTKHDQSLAMRLFTSLQYCIANMLQQYTKQNTSSVFAMDDMYFVLVMKAIAGKIMTATGINSILKNPKSMMNSLAKNPTRLIMGGSNDIDIIDDAIELYVRLPLLVEFYRSIFDDGNKKSKQDAVTDPLDEETIAFVPEIGNVWSGLISNIFDKSKYIDSGIYTSDNMKKIVAEVNSIYKNYKDAAPAPQLVRYIVLQLVAEINRRYGIIKRQELQQYYRAINSAKKDTFSFNELNHSSNDFDILHEELEFEDKAPSDMYIQVKEALKDPSVSMDTKINKLTDYKIVKDFRERIQAAMSSGIVDGSTLTITDRIRSLKQMVKMTTSRSEKYDIIAKAIEESDAMNQAPNDIYTCFHELVLTPLRTAHQMYKSLNVFLLTSFQLVVCGKAEPVLKELYEDPIFESIVKYGSKEITFIDALNAETYEHRAKFILKDTFAGIDAHDTYLKLKDNNMCIVNHNNDIVNGKISLVMMQLLTNFTFASEDLIKMNISSTKRITIDFSEYQKVIERLIGDVKFMIDKFTGIIPKEFIDKVANHSEVGSVYWLEDKCVNHMFNKLNKSERDRSVISIDNFTNLMNHISAIIFNNTINPNVLLQDMLISPMDVTNDTDNSHSVNIRGTTKVTDTITIIRDSFKVYDVSARSFVKSDDGCIISNLLFTPSLKVETISSGLIQQYNTLIARYLNDMYDESGHKMYNGTFSTFSNNMLIDAINGKCIPDFTTNTDQTIDSLYDIPSSQIVLSSTLAYVMKTMISRVNPLTNMKVHEVVSLNEISAHVRQRYHVVIPLYLRIFKNFLRRCQSYRTLIGKSTVGPLVNELTIGNNAISSTVMIDYNSKSACLVHENKNDEKIRFGKIINTINEQIKLAKDKISLQPLQLTILMIDEIINGTVSLIKDIEHVQSELLEVDPSVPMFFDVKHEFTKNYVSYVNNRPFIPVSSIGIGFKKELLMPIYGNSIPNDKFLLGIRSLLNEQFKLSVDNVPYMKEITNTFNGLSTATNKITDKKINGVLSEIGRATSYLYDMRFFTGTFIGSMLNFTQNETKFPLFQEMSDVEKSIGLIESTNPIDSKNTIALFVKEALHPPPLLPSDGSIPTSSLFTRIKTAMSHYIYGDTTTIVAATIRLNPRANAIMVNILDLNIMPINVHSLMREIPLVNIYNYAMTFDAIMHSLNITDFTKQVLLDPYKPLKLVLNSNGKVIEKLAINNTHMDISTIQTNSISRFVKDILINKLMRNPTDRQLKANEYSAIQDRLDSKLYHNLLFLTSMQYAIRAKVKEELEFINTRVVSDVAVVSPVITNAANDDGVEITDSLFEF